MAASNYRFALFWQAMIKVIRDCGPSLYSQVLYDAMFLSKSKRWAATNYLRTLTSRYGPFKVVERDNAPYVVRRE